MRSDFFGVRTQRVMHTLALSSLAFLMLSFLGSCQLLPSEPHNGPHIVWKKPLDGGVESSSAWHGIPGADAGRVYFLTDSGAVAFVASTGQRAWSQTLWHMTSVPGWNVVVRNDLVFFAGRERVYAVDASTGLVRWSTVIDGLADGAYVLATEDAIYAGSRTDIAYALSSSDGHVLWKSSFSGSFKFGGPLVGFGVSGDTLYAGGSENLAENGYVKRAVIIAYNRKTGVELWRYFSPLTQSSGGGPLSVTDSLVLSGDLLDNSFFAVNRFTGTEVWRVRGEPGSFGPDNGPLVSGDTAFIVSNDQHAYAVNVRTGVRFWRTAVSASAFRFALCGDYVLSNELEVTAVRRTDGRVSAHLLRQNDAKPNEGFPTSGFGVSGNVAVVTGTRATYGIRCE